jgi:hypothetical protein
MRVPYQRLERTYASASRRLEGQATRHLARPLTHTVRAQVDE